jgi:MOSC domain-containing protein YiiM
MNFEVLHLFTSPGHNYFGHHGQPADEHPIQEVAEVDCIAGRGLRGDRFFDYKENYKGQVTFFSDEVFQSLCQQFNMWDKPVSVFRRNVVTRGLGLNSLIGEEFKLQGAWFIGVEECRPCHWMDEAFCPGAAAALRGRGGLRARILTGGILRVTAPAVGRDRFVRAAVAA